MSESKTYVRDATGLVREIGVVTATIFILSNVIGGGWQQRVFKTTGTAPLHPSDMMLPVDPLVIAFLITGAASIATVFVFAVMATAMPRAGGGYVYISRTISPGVGFVCAWAEFMGIALSYGLIAVLCVEFAAIFLPVAGVTGLDFLTDPLVLLVLGVVFTFAFAGLAYFGTSMTGKFLHLMFWIPAAITLLIYLFLFLAVLDPTLLSDPTTGGVVKITGHTTDNWIEKAVEVGIDGVRADTYVDAVNASIMGAYWSWIGYAAISFAAGEVKEANRSLPISHLAAGFIILGVYITISTFLSLASSIPHSTGGGGGWTFFQALAYLGQGAGKGQPGYPGHGWMPIIAMYSATGMGLDILNVFFAIAAILWLANDLPPFITTSSRIVFAMSFDRALPEAFAKVDERWHSPTNAIIFCAVVACLGCVGEADAIQKTFIGDIPVIGTILGDIFNPGGSIGGTDLLDAVFFTAACVSAIILPSKLKDVYERSAWRPKITGREAVVVIGIIALILNIYIDLIILGPASAGVLLPLEGLTGFLGFIPPFIPDLAVGGGLIPDMADPIGTINWWFWWYIFLIVIGAVIYIVMKRYYTARGVDFSTIYASIPPE
ncbi:MAG: amino acid permease [Candidatus Heimdallarchaeota archaeon]|nr:MAG: amino acid permease [Candidatus Heimdallarchaeota archaeon]